jgi:hypothetical protein
MSNSVKHISPSDFVFKSISMSPVTNREYSSENQFLLVDKYVIFGTSTSVSKPTDKLGERALFEIKGYFLDNF